MKYLKNQIFMFKRKRKNQSIAISEVMPRQLVGCALARKHHRDLQI